MQQNKSELVNKIDLAKKYLGERRDKKALKILNKAVKESPLDYESWLYLGIVERRLGELDKAVECFKAACEFNPSELEAWGLLTVTLLDQRNLDMAKKTIEKASKLNPFDTKIQLFRNNLIRIYTKYGPFF